MNANMKPHKVEEPEIWCLIGNPGCGKTFLTKRIALRFSEYELKHISYLIAIPCPTLTGIPWNRPEWKKTRQAVTTEFVQEWLCLGLPVISDCIY